MYPNSKFALSLVVILASCTTTYESFPDAAEKLEVLPATAFTSDFDLESELRVATKACVASETKGPVSLTVLQERGFVLYSDIGSKGYTKAESREGKGRFETSDVIRVYDPNSAIPCTVEVPRNTGSRAFGSISDEMERLGYARQQSGRFVHFIGKGQRFQVYGFTSRYSGWANIEISRIDP
jgi:hypothetical protein